MKLRKNLAIFLALVVFMTPICISEVITLAYDTGQDDGYNTVIVGLDFERWQTVNRTFLYSRMQAPAAGFTAPDLQTSIVTAPVGMEEHGNVVRVPVYTDEMQSNPRDGQRLWIEGKIINPKLVDGEEASQDIVNELALSKLQIDVMVDALTPFEILIAEYAPSATSGDPSATNRRALAWFDGEGNITFPNSNNTETYGINTWYSFTFYMDYANQTYTAYINGKSVVENGSLSKTGYIFKPALNFGILWNDNKTAASNIYVDNMKYSVPGMYTQNYVFAEPLPPVAFADYEGYTGLVNKDGGGKDEGGIPFRNQPTTVNYDSRTSGTLRSYVTAENAGLPDAAEHGTVLKCTLGNNELNWIGTTPEAVYANYATETPEGCDLYNLQHVKFSADFLAVDADNAWLLAVNGINRNTSKLLNNPFNMVRILNGEIVFINSTASTNFDNTSYPHIRIPYTVDKWYNIELWVDFENFTYDAWLNGRLIGKSLEFGHANATPILYPLTFMFRTLNKRGGTAGVDGSTGGVDKTFYLDNIELRTGAEGEIKPILITTKNSDNSYRVAYVPQEVVPGAALIAAGYTEGAISEIDMSVSSSNGSILVAAIDKTAGKIKAFLWESLGSLMPLRDVLDIK
ncbi:MAG: hypothetical protein M0R40_02225 [Firmicutes bacterium]|nr:hypothetical protein [Bacillota bacterium]